MVGEAAYCRRHAGMMAALLTLPEEDRECPDLDNRAASLLEHVARRLHQPAVQMLQARGIESPGSSIVVDALHMTKGGPPRVRGWEHRWRLVDHTGPLATIGLRVDEETDSLVQVKVDGAVVRTAEPPWIAVRVAGSDEEDTARREAYEQELINAMFESLQRRQEFGYSDGRSSIAPPGRPSPPEPRAAEPAASKPKSRRDGGHATSVRK
jgi:hypothetical protein